MTLDPWQTTVLVVVGSGALMGAGIAISGLLAVWRENRSRDR